MEAFPFAGLSQSAIRLSRCSYAAPMPLPPPITTSLRLVNCCAIFFSLPFPDVTYLLVGWLIGPADAPLGRRRPLEQGVEHRGRHAQHDTVPGMGTGSLARPGHAGPGEQQRTLQRRQERLRRAAC